jgi:hypothetical protein
MFVLIALEFIQEGRPFDESSGNVCMAYVRMVLQNGNSESVCSKHGCYFDQ